MAARLNPYLNFADTSRAAMEFYQSVFGGQLDIMTFGQFGAPEGVDPEGVMHAYLETDLGFELMASDLPPGMEPTTGSGSVTCSISGDDTEALTGYWEQLSAGGQVTTPLETQMWGDTFGSCVDRFGVPWLVNIAGAPAG
ncbi:MAG: VOC family protein [Dermatophilaceae bacterium]